MSIVPLRNLGSSGIITDVDPFDLPVEAFSFGKNIRFENGRIERGSVFRRIGNPLAKHPSHVVAYTGSTGGPEVILCNSDGTLTDYTTRGDLSPAGTSPVEARSAITHAVANNVVFLNRNNRVPWYRSKADTGPFQPLPSGDGQWDPSWRCEALRSVAGVLVALNITKGAQSLPNDVMWSNFVPLNGLPDWDYGSTTSSAGENTLAQMEDPIVDGCTLKSRLMIYGANETWFMEYTGDNAMFRFDRQFDQGVISSNCVVEHGGIHYVFGTTDIWMHDGMSDKSLANGRVRKFIYDTMKKSASDLFFVAHNPNLNEIMFCYVSDDPYLAFPSTNPDGCNRAAIYNYAADTWYFADLPYVTAAGLGTTSQGQTIDSMTISVDQAGGSYASYEGDTKKNLLFAHVADAGLSLDHNLRTFDLVNSVSTTDVIATGCSPGALLVRTGLDLDELKAELRGYKLCSSIYPQGRLDAEADPLIFTVGSSDHPNAAPLYGFPQTYDSRWYKLDHNIAGRYLSYQIEQTDYRFFTLSGLDFDLQILGSR